MKACAVALVLIIQTTSAFCQGSGVLQRLENELNNVDKRSGFAEYDEDAWSKCIERLMKSDMTKQASHLARTVCRHQAVPKMCRSIDIKKLRPGSYPDQIGKIPDEELLKKLPRYKKLRETAWEKDAKSKIGSTLTVEEIAVLDLVPETGREARAACIERCSQASFWSRKFGDCSFD